MTFFALFRYRPMEAMKGTSPASPSSSIFAGVSATANSLSVALLTATSVAWADRATATTSV